MSYFTGMPCCPLCHRTRKIGYYFHAFVCKSCSNFFWYRLKKAKRSNEFKSECVVALKNDRNHQKDK